MKKNSNICKDLLAGNVTAVKKILDSGKIGIESPVNKDRTALKYVLRETPIDQDNSEIVRLLLERVVMS